MQDGHSLHSHSIGYTIRVCGVAAAYFVFALMGAFSSVRSGYPASVWPASGIALAAVLRYRSGIWPGIFLGSVAAALYRLSGIISQTALSGPYAGAAVIAIGSTLQAVFGAFLIHRFMGSGLDLCEEKDATLFLVLGGPVACLLNATTSVACLTFMDILPHNDVLFNWWTWWIGDCLGVLAIAPAALSLAASPGDIWRTRRLSVALPLCLTLFTIVCLHISIDNREQDRKHADFRHKAEVICDHVRGEWDDYLDTLHTMAALLATDGVQRSQFNALAQYWSSRHKGIETLAWLPRVADGNRLEYEEAAGRDGYPDFRLTEESEHGVLVERSRNSEYFPVHFIAPRGEGENQPGFDTASVPVLLAAMEKAGATSAPAAAARTALTGNESEFITFLPVFRRLPDPDATEHDKALKGFVSVAFRVSDTMETCLSGMQTHGIQIELADETAASNAGPLFTMGRDPQVKTVLEATTGPTAHPWFSTGMDVAARKWKLAFTPTPDYLIEHRSPHAWLLLFCGMLFTGLAGAFLLVVSGRTTRGEALVKERTAELKREISERKIVEKELSRQTALLSDIINSIPDLVFFKDENGFFLGCNTRFAEFIGQPRDAITGQKDDALFAGNAARMFRENDLLVMQNGKAHHNEDWLDYPDGRRILVDTFKAPLRNPEGKSIGVVGVSRDITDRKMLEEALRESETVLKTIIDSMQVGLIVVDAQSRAIVDANAYATRTIGRELRDLVGKECHQFICAAEPHQCPLRDPDLKVEEAERNLLNPEGNPVPVLKTAARFQQNGREYILETFTDISKLKRTESALKISHAFLEIAHRQQDLHLLLTEFMSEVKKVTGCSVVAIRGLGEEGNVIDEIRDGVEEPVEILDDWLTQCVNSDVVSSNKNLVLTTPAFPHRGVFCHNKARSTLAATPCPDKSHEREGKAPEIPYESLGRISMWSQERLYGFIYAADPRECMFSREMVDSLDSASMQMGSAIQKVLAQESLVTAHHQLEQRVFERTRDLSDIITTLAHEINERKRIEERLRTESAFREAIIAHASEGLFVWHPIEAPPYLAFTVWNHRLEETTGYTMEEINRMGWLETMYPDADIQRTAQDCLKRLISGEPVIRQDRIIRRADGQERAIILSSSPIRSGDKTKHVVGIVQDITDLKMAEKALRESEEQFRGLVENISAGILIVKDGNIEYRNPEQQRLTSGLPEHYRMDDLVALIHPDDRPVFAAWLESARPQNGGLPEIVFRLRDRSAGTPSPRWISCRKSAIEYRGAPAGLITMMDITQLKEMERHVMLREKMASLGHVAAGIAHEIRNPLSGINIYLDTIRENFRDPDSADDILQLIDEAQATSNKIESVIKRVVDFARPTDLHLRPTAINQAIQEAVKLAAATLRKTSVILELNLASDLPPVYADTQLFEQVMLNLISNAAGVLRMAQGDRRIAVSTGTHGRNIMIRVEDTGPGIPPEMRERVFEPFFTTGSHGMGIGLGICRRIISDHRGEIAISASPMGGAQFTILIPIEKRERPV